jgi:hypothetical protein
MSGDPWAELHEEMTLRHREQLELVRHIDARRRAVIELRRRALSDYVRRDIERTTYLLAQYDAEVAEAAMVARAHELLDN